MRTFLNIVFGGLMLVIVLFLCAVLLMAGIALKREVHTPEPPAPKYSVGECFFVDYEREQWEPINKYKVRMVTKDAYLVADSPVPNWRKKPGWFTNEIVPFSFQNRTERTSCDG